MGTASCWPIDVAIVLQPMAAAAAGCSAAAAVVGGVGAYVLTFIEDAGRLCGAVIGFGC